MFHSDKTRLVTVAAVARRSPRYRLQPLDQETSRTNWLLLFLQQLPPPTPISAVLAVQRQHHLEQTEKIERLQK